MWKKILYFAAAVVFGIIFYMGIYSANLSEHKSLLVDTAIANKDYHVVPQVFLEVPFDTKSIVETNDEDAVVKVYPATGMVNYSFTVGETTNSYSRYEKAYLLFMFETDFSLASYTDSGNNNVNKSGIRFIGEKASYDFYFVQNETYNAGSYVAEPKNEFQYALQGGRDIAAINSDWHFVPVSLAETTINLITEVTGTINKIQILDAIGDVKIEENISFSFTESFFSHEFINNTYVSVNELLTKYYATTDSNEQNTLTDEINGKLDSFKEGFYEGTKDTGYALTLPAKEIEPDSVYWKTFAYLGLYAVLVFFFYAILFHFKQILGFIKGILKGNNSKKNVTYVVKKDELKPEKVVDNNEKSK